MIRLRIPKFHHLLMAVLVVAAMMTGQCAWALDQLKVNDYTFSTGTDGEGEYYVIDGTTALNALATYVNAGNNASGKRFKMTTSVTYSYVSGYVWNSDSETYNTIENNNYTPIGNTTYGFSGTFDGDGKTVSGIRIFRDGSGDVAQCLGLFGYVGVGGKVKNVTIADVRITGHDNVGGIAGKNQGIVANSHVASNVAIHAVNISASNHGGIVGYNVNSGSEVSYCTSAAQLSIKEGVTGTDFYGGIVGANEGAIRYNIADGAIVAKTAGVQGAISGVNTDSGYCYYNYYANCTVGESTSNVGTGLGDVAVNDGAVAATVLHENTPVSSSLTGKVAFRREFTGGRPSTVVFPFGYTKGSEGTYYTFTGVSYNSTTSHWEATMTEVGVSTLAPNTPYLFKPAGTGTHQVVLFHGTAAYAAAGATVIGKWTFKGVYEPKTWTAGEIGNDYGFAATNGKGTDGVTDVAAGEFVQIGAGAHIRPLRSYLTYTGGGNPWAAPARRDAPQELPQTITVVLRAANGQTTLIDRLPDMQSGKSGEWYSLGGVRLNGMPTVPGVYIFNGEKVVIKSGKEVLK